MNKVILNGADLSIEDVVKVAREGYGVEIDTKCMARIAEVREYMEREWMREDAPAVYGFNTGLGKHKDCKVSIEESDLTNTVRCCPTAAVWASLRRRMWSVRLYAYG